MRPVRIWFRTTGFFSKREALLQQVTEQNSFDSAVELVRNHIGEIFQTLSDANSSSGQRQARLALDYIQKNYMDPDFKPEQYLFLSEYQHKLFQYDL